MNIFSKTDVAYEEQRSPKILQELFNEAGVSINGPNPWDMQVHDPITYSEILSKWSLGMGESYMNGHWDCKKLDQMLTKLLSCDMNMRVQGIAKARFALEVLRARLINLQSKSRAFQVGKEHYDIGNDVFELMLDPLMMYSCGYWEHANTLAEAQEHKLELICKKLQLKPGERLLEIGCGWGGLAAYAAKNYGVEVLGITVSKEQQQLAIERCQGLPVQIELIDYRDLVGQFDKIVSVGMFEHVGEKNYLIYFQTVNKLLSNDGLFLLHSIGSDVTISRTDPWIDRYIFPNGKIPSPMEVGRSIEGIFLIEDWQNFGQDYDKTLMAWHDNFTKNWQQISSKYDQRFYRMWTYYLLSCAAYFRSRQGQLWQIVLSKRTRLETYRSVRPFKYPVM
jgi:cyclopropane-fatty-acyl-phospholipid synthase